MVRKLNDREGRITWSQQKRLGFGHWINDILVKRITVNKSKDAEATGSPEFKKPRLFRGDGSALGRSRGK